MNDQSQFVPGVMRCAKCNFVLHRVTMHVLSGGMSAGSNETEPCPNGCGPLWPMTWRQQAEELQERCEEQMARAVAAENALRYARPLVEKWCHYQGDNAAFRAETLAPIDAALNGSTKEDQHG